MARKKVNLAWIPNDAVRRATFKKRRRGLFKKVSELSILCDIRACAIVYGPHEAQPEVWPSESEASLILQHFKELPAMDQEKKMINQEGFLQQRVDKMFEQFQRMEREIREIDINVMMYEDMFYDHILLGLGVEEATSLLGFIDMQLKAIQENINAARIMGSEATVNNGLFLHGLYPVQINGQIVHGSSSAGLIFEMLQPYMTFK